MTKHDLQEGDTVRFLEEHDWRGAFPSAKATVDSDPGHMTITREAP